MFLNINGSVSVIVGLSGKTDFDGAFISSPFHSFPPSLVAENQHRVIQSTELRSGSFVLKKKKKRINSGLLTDKRVLLKSVRFGSRVLSGDPRNALGGRDNHEELIPSGGRKVSYLLNDSHFKTTPLPPNEASPRGHFEALGGSVPACLRRTRQKHDAVSFCLRVSGREALPPARKGEPGSPSSSAQATRNDARAGRGLTGRDCDPRTRRGATAGKGRGSLTLAEA